MSKEFKQIPFAPMYEINKEGEVIKIETGNRIFPSPIGSDTIWLFVDDKKKSIFKVTEIVSKVFTQDASAINIDDITDFPGNAPEGEERKEQNAAKSAKRRGNAKNGRNNSLIRYCPKDDRQKKIVELDCKLSIKMWKLYKDAGLKVDEIKEVIIYPNYPIEDTINNYKKSESLRKRAESVK